MAPSPLFAGRGRPLEAPDRSRPIGYISLCKRFPSGRVVGPRLPNLREETTDPVARVAFRDAEPLAGRYRAGDSDAVEDMKEALIWH